MSPFEHQTGRIASYTQAGNGSDRGAVTALIPAVFAGSLSRLAKSSSSLARHRETPGVCHDRSRGAGGLRWGCPTDSRHFPSNCAKKPRQIGGSSGTIIPSPLDSDSGVRPRNTGAASPQYTGASPQTKRFCKPARASLTKAVRASTAGLLNLDASPNPRNDGPMNSDYLSASDGGRQ